MSKKSLLVYLIVLLGIATVTAWYFSFEKQQEQTANSVKVSALFLGNSFIYVNNLPKMVADIAQFQGDTLDYDSNAPGGYKLSQHLRDEVSLNKIKSKKWDFIILQEQSQLPSFTDSQSADEFNSPALKLNNVILQTNRTTKVVFYETWGYKNGDTDNCKYDATVCYYSGMQERLIKHYTEVATQTSALLAPVGQAWSVVRTQHPEIDLYNSDGKHPSPEGTYLAACILYIKLFKKSVINASDLNIEKTKALILRQVAQQVVLPQ